MYGKNLNHDRLFPIFYNFAQKLNFIMKYYVASFKITCPTELLQTSRDLLADAAGEAGFESFEDTPDGIKGYVQKELFDKDILTNNLEQFPLEDVVISYIVENAEDKDWNEQWENVGFTPIIVNDNIIIYDAKHTTLNQLDELTSHSTNFISIAIDAKLAFGTGSHQTTRMIVSTLLKNDLNDKRMLDCGCGTGILGITAAKLGAKDVIGYDIDEWSVEKAKQKAEINGVTNLTVYHGDSKVLNHVNGIFDVVAANINRNILLEDLHIFKNVMRQDGILILSGFYEEDIP